MTDYLFTEIVDIYKRPHVSQDFTGMRVTIGDLHANAIKLLFMIIKHGIASNISEEEYQQLIRIYNTPTHAITTPLLTQFNQILNKMKFNNKIAIRLIGDELADRGHNDYFTLAILDKLHEHHVPVEIILSNHGVEFLEACEKQQPLYPSILSPDVANSMLSLQQLINNGVISKSEVLSMVNRVYKPTLRTITYSLSEDHTDITLFSHAGIGLNTIRDLANSFNVPYLDKTATDLAKTIDGINLVFQRHVQNNTFNLLYAHMRFAQGNPNALEALINIPLAFIMWNRRYDNLYRPAVLNNYHLCFVHGHDSSELTHHNICNLDNQLGKYDDLNHGLNSVLCSAEPSLTRAKKPIEASHVGTQSPAIPKVATPIEPSATLNDHYKQLIGQEAILGRELKKLSIHIERPVSFLESYVSRWFAKKKHAPIVNEALELLKTTYPPPQEPSSADCLNVLNQVELKHPVEKSGKGTYDAMRWGLEVLAFLEKTLGPNNKQTPHCFCGITKYASGPEVDQAMIQLMSVITNPTGTDSQSLSDLMDQEDNSSTTISFRKLT